MDGSAGVQVVRCREEDERWKTNAMSAIRPKRQASETAGDSMSQCDGNMDTPPWYHEPVDRRPRRPQAAARTARTADTGTGRGMRQARRRLSNF